MRHARAGFTLFEIVAVLALISLLAALILPSLARGTGGVEERLCRDQLLSDLGAARAAAIGKRQEAAVDFDSRSYSIRLPGLPPVTRGLPEDLSFAGGGSAVFKPDGTSNGLAPELLSPSGSCKLKIGQDGTYDWE